MKSYDKGVFVDKLSSLDWTKVSNDENVNDSWKTFHEMFLEILDRVAPVKNVRLKQRTEQWFTGDILRSISVRDKAWKQYRKQKTSENFTEYKRLRNKTDALIKNAKKDFVKNKIEENKSCPKKLWKTLKSLGIPTKVKEASSNIGLKNENDEVCFDSDFVANKFNHYFCNIAEKLVNKLPLRTYGEDRVEDFYKGKGVERNSFKFNVVGQDEVENILKSLDVAKSVGEDKISGKFLRDAAEVISSPITYIVNLSLKSATVPDDFKLARVLPIYKKGNQNDEGNYRPVSILPVVSKVLERIVYKQMHNYLEHNNLIYAFQSGFRSAHSTDTALTFLADKLRANMDNGLYTGMVLIDLQKAFDTVDHTILTKKLKAIGVDDHAGAWFKSYLAGRNQVVKVNGSVSTAGNITCGVPQGSILGPLLFIIYVNDMVTSVNCDLFLYADDSTLLVSGKHPTDIQKSLSNELNSVRGWLEENKLSIHLGKTESILIASKIRLARTDSLQISCGNVAIESKSKITYLGLTFDSDMSFSSMGNSVIKKVNAKLKFLYRKRDFFGANERKLLCSALVNPHFEYACNAWYRSVNAKVKHKLQTAQNKMIRYLLNYGCRRHIGFNDFKKSNFLDINARVDYMSLNMMFNIFNNVAPSYMCDIDRITHSHNTRHSDSVCVVPRVKDQGSKSFKFNGCKLWNELPTNVKNAQQKFRFKKVCKTLLMTKMKLKEEMNCVP